MIPEIEGGIDTADYFRLYDLSLHTNFNERIKAKDKISRVSLKLWWNEEKQMKETNLEVDVWIIYKLNFHIKFGSSNSKIFVVK